MADQKQIIAGLQEAAAYFRSSFDAMYGTVACEKFRGWTDAIEQAIAMLKAQEPVESMLKREGWNKYHNDYVCPVCDQELVYEQNYCSECGRAVKWE